MPPPSLPGPIMGEGRAANSCLTCRHNTYREISTDWFDCCHPVTIARGPKWQPGDPAMVNYRTGDVPVSRIGEMGDCPAFEAFASTPAAEGGE